MSSNPALTVVVPSAETLSDITSTMSLSPVNVLEVDASMVSLASEGLEPNSELDPVLSAYLYATSLAGPEEQEVFKEQARLWVIDALKLDKTERDVQKLYFAKKLKSGALGVRLVQTFWPEAIPSVLQSITGPQSDKAHLNAFVDACQLLQVPAFTSSSTRSQARQDILLYHSSRSILYCILELAKIAAKQGFAVPPRIISLENEISGAVPISSSEVRDQTQSSESAREVQVSCTQIEQCEVTISITPKCRQQPEIRPSKWRSYASYAPAPPSPTGMSPTVCSSSTSSPNLEAAAHRERSFSTQSRSKWRQIASHHYTPTHSISSPTASPRCAESGSSTSESRTVRERSASSHVISLPSPHSRSNSIDDQELEGKVPSNTPIFESPVTFIFDYAPVPGDAIDEAVAKCFHQHKLPIRPVRVSSGQYVFSSANRVMRSPMASSELLSPRLKRASSASRVFNFGGPAPSLSPRSLSALPLGITPKTAPVGLESPSPSPEPDIFEISVPIRVVAEVVLVWYDKRWISLRSFVNRFVEHMRKLKSKTNTASTHPLTPVCMNENGDTVPSTLGVREAAGVCETDIIALEDQLRECFLDTLLPKLPQFDLSKLTQFSTELLFRRAILEGVSCDQYDEFIEQELVRLIGSSAPNCKEQSASAPSLQPDSNEPHQTKPSIDTNEVNESSGKDKPPRVSQIRQKVRNFLRKSQ
jgi:hypothetical protein